MNSDTGGANGDNKAESGDIALYSPCKVLIFVCLMSGMLFLMYYFYNILSRWDTKGTVFNRNIAIIFTHFVLLCPSLCHDRHILHRVCLRTLQLLRCGVGEIGLRPRKVFASLYLTFLALSGTSEMVMEGFLCLILVSLSSFTVLNANFSLRSLILASVCICISVVWAVYRNEDRYLVCNQANG